MDISVKRYLDILMTEDFAERFYFYSRLNTASCKGVSERVEMYAIQFTDSSNFAEIVPKSGWFNKMSDFT